MDYFIPKKDVIESIEYFKNLGLNSDDNLFIFLMAKKAGISMTYPVTFSTGKLSNEQKSDFLNTIWMFAGLFDSNESAEKNSIMFPNGFATVGLYNPGTEYSKIVGRIADTIRNSNKYEPLYTNEDGNLRLKQNYQEILKENFLNGNKISLRHLSAWIFRNTKFEFETIPTDRQFTRVIEKAIKKFLRITKKDFLWLFEDDLSFNRFQPANVSILGSEVREQFIFTTKIPVVEVSANLQEYQNSFYSKEVTTQYLELNGDNPSDKAIIATLLDKKQIILTGVPGVGKSRYTTLLKESDLFIESEMIQFHSNYSYEDFIGSETLVNDNGATVVSTKMGVFLTFIQKALSDPNNKYLFIIDELNRGNIAEIFGETILTLDRGYDVKLTKKIVDIESIKVPENLYIVGTMNTSDRNIAFLDLAIRRRFAFINLLPNYEFLSESISVRDIDLGNVLKIINQRIIETLREPELLLGQSYFIPNKRHSEDTTWTMEEFQNQFNFVLLPTLKEYSFDNENAINAIVGENLSDSIQDINEFSEAFLAEFSV